jgi:protein SCO1/2
MNARSSRGVARALALAALALAVAGSALATPAVAAERTVKEAAALPTDSVYQLPAALTDQSGRTFRLDERRGQPMLVSMFYTSCQFVCPMLIDALRDTAKQLKDSEREHLGVLVVSFDPAHDSTAVLKRTFDDRGLDAAHWSLARTDPTTTRKLASVLGIQYRALGNGDFNHTTVLLLLDGQGRIVARTSQLGNADPAFVKRVRAVVQAAQQ